MKGYMKVLSNAKGSGVCVCRGKDGRITIASNIKGKNVTKGSMVKVDENQKKTGFIR